VKQVPDPVIVVTSDDEDDDFMASAGDQLNKPAAVSCRVRVPNRA
jgi:hypothetical protein